MLDFDPNRPVVAPKDAATVLALRDGSADGSAPGRGVEVYCVRRHAQSAFLGGAVVFPGGKLDGADGEPIWADLSSGVHSRAGVVAGAAGHALALAVCACRELCEEAAILPSHPASVDEAARRIQGASTARPFAELLSEAGLRLDTGALVPFARWVTPEAEQRRFDARFYLLATPPGQEGAHDAHETTWGMWARPAQIIDAFMAGQLFLAPPTLRSLEILGAAATVAHALELAAEQSLLPICPRFVPGDPAMLVIPGDPLHDIAEKRIIGGTRFVLRDGRFLSEEP